MMVGCQSVEPQDYVHLGICDYTLLGETSSLNVTVEASGPYTAQSDASWLEITAQTPNSLTLTAAENTVEALRSTVVTVTSGTASEQIRIDQYMKENKYHYRRHLSERPLHCHQHR